MPSVPLTYCRNAIAMSQESETANLPAYLLKQGDGIFVDLSRFPVGGGFEEFIDKFFAEGMRFKHVDYRLLTGLLYDYDSILDAHGINAKVKLAEDVVVFAPLRKPLYKNVKVDSAGGFAEYFFEPVEVSVIVEEPVYGEPGDDGVAPIVGKTRKEGVRPAKLDMDEFIADMWLKGVRFGIDIETVSGVMSRRETVRMHVAVQLDATEGSDAEIVEASEALRRDDSPKLLANGKADLRKFQNRFPQIAMGEKLLRKNPRVLGKPGCKVTGVLIEPEVPKDLDIFPLAGAGTKVEKQDGIEYIVATREGFLSLDVESNHIAVTEKIENKGGISIKTTGDLSLSGNEFIEHGEVQEGRVVEGKNMTFHSDVYGDLVSQGGFILLESTLSKGSAKSIGGDVTSNGRVLNSAIEAWDGKVSLNYAEGCTIFGESVVIDRAINCEIIADDVQIEIAEGCAIAGKNVRIASSNAYRGKDSAVSVLVPDLTATDAQIEAVNQSVIGCKKVIAAKDQGLGLIKSDAEVARYLSLATSVEQGVVKLNAAQQDNWYQMTAKFAKVNSAIAKLNAEKQEQLKKMKDFRQELTYLLATRGKQGVGAQCVIDDVEGDTWVRVRNSHNGIAAFKKMTAVEIKTKLREQGSLEERIFFDDEGQVDWHYHLPEIVVELD